MNIETKAARISSGEDSQHGVRSFPDPPKNASIVRLRSLLRRESQSERASEDAYFPTPAEGTITPQPSGSSPIHPASRQAAEDARSAYEGLTVPKLQDEIDKRNDGRGDDDHISRNGVKRDLIERLLADDERQLASV